MSRALSAPRLAQFVTLIDSIFTATKASRLTSTDIRRNITSSQSEVSLLAPRTMRTYIAAAIKDLGTRPDYTFVQGSMNVPSVLERQWAPDSVEEEEALSNKARYIGACRAHLLANPTNSFTTSQMVAALEPQFSNLSEATQKIYATNAMKALATTGEFDILRGPYNARALAYIPDDAPVVTKVVPALDPVPVPTNPGRLPNPFETPRVQQFLPDDNDPTSCVCVVGSRLFINVGDGAIEMNGTSANIELLRRALDTIESNLEG